MSLVGQVSPRRSFMPRVHRFFPLSEVRAEARRLASLGLHIGVDIDRPEPLFGSGWDRDARELGRTFKSLNLGVIARGPGFDLPLGALDQTVSEQVRACHDRALAVAQHLGASAYLVRREPLHGVPRVQQLARLEAAAGLLRELAGKAKARGIQVFLQQAVECDERSLVSTLALAESASIGVVRSPARTRWAKCEHVDYALQGVRLPLAIDLTDMSSGDLDLTAPLRGQFQDLDSLRSLVERPDVAWCCAEGHGSATEDLVAALNDIARSKPRIECEGNAA